MLRPTKLGKVKDLHVEVRSVTVVNNALRPLPKTSRQSFPSGTELPNCC